MTGRDQVHLSKCMSHALRHAPEECGLELDKNGWIEIAELLRSIQQRCPGGDLAPESMIVDVARTSSKSRFEMRDGLIRARYGHSLADRNIVNEEIVPSVVLFHATDPVNGTHLDQRIVADGKAVCSYERERGGCEAGALEAGRRKAGRPVLLRIAALGAYKSGVAFFLGSENISLAKAVPPGFLSVVSSSE